MTVRFSHLAAALALALGCKGSGKTPDTEVAKTTEPAPAPAPVPPPPPPPPEQTGSGGAEHRGSASDDGGQKFAAFKETWVYVDGEPRGVLMFPEIPSWQEVAWKDDVEGLDFTPQTPPDKRNKDVQLLRYRLTDYLKNIGVDVAKVKVVYIHGSGYVEINHDTLMKYADGITFDFTGNDMTKTRFYWPMDMKVNTSYDRYAAVSVFINKPPLKLDNHNNPFIDGQEVNGIPYHGTPERGGVRVYLDGKLAMVIKRNLLSDVGRVTKGEPRWSLYKLLEANGVKADVAAIDVVSDKDVYNLHRDRLPDDALKDVTFATSTAVSGEVVFGKDNLAVNAFLLYSKGHVPPVVPLPELKRDKPKADAPKK